MASVENAGGASPLEEVVVPRASPGIDDMLDAAAEPPARHVRRISDSEAVDTVAAAIAMDGGNDADADADADANGGAADDGDDIRPSGSGSGSGTGGGGDDKDSDRANRGVEAILQVAASADEEDEAAAADALKSVGPLRPRPHRPVADGGSGGGGGGNNRPKEGKGGPQRAPPPQRPGIPPPPPPGGYPGPSGAYHHPYGPSPYYYGSYGPYGPPPPGGPFGPYAHRGPPPPPGYFAHPRATGGSGAIPPPHLPRFNVPTPNTSWEESSPTQPTHAPRPSKRDQNTDTVGGGGGSSASDGSSSNKDQATPTQTDGGVTLSTSSSKGSGPRGQKTSATDANIVSPPKSQQEEHDTSKVATEQGDGGNGRSAGIKMVASTVSASSSRDEVDKTGSSSKDSSPSRPTTRDKAATAPPWGYPDYSSYPSYGGALYWAPGDSFGQPGYSGDSGKNVHLPYRQLGRYYKLPPSSPVRRPDLKEQADSGPSNFSEDDRAAAARRAMTSPTDVIPYRTRSKPSPTVSRSFSSDRGDHSYPSSHPSYGPAGVPPHSPIRSSSQHHYAGDREGRKGSGTGAGGGSIPPTPRTPRTPSRHEAAYEGPYIEMVNSSSWGYSTEFGPPPSDGPGYPQTPTSSFAAPGEEGSYYVSPSGHEYGGRPPIGPSASYESTHSSSGQPRPYGYDSGAAYHHPGGPYATASYSRDEEDPAYLLRDYDPNQDARAIYSSGSYDGYGATTQIDLPKKNRKAAKTTAPLDPNDPSITTGVSILTGNTHVPPPESASEVTFNVHKPPMKPIVKEGTRPVCNSISELNSNDVLLGRGGGTNTQVGNRRFRELVTDFQPTYLMAKRKEKPLLARSIVLVIRKRGGRFVKKDDKSGRLHEVGDEKAEAKTSQALREGLDVRATKSAANALLKREKEEKKRRKAAAAAASRRPSKRRHDEEAYYESPPRYSREGPPTPYYSHYPYSHSPRGGYEYPSPQCQQSQQYGGGAPPPSSSSYDREDDRGGKRSREYYEQQFHHQQQQEHHRLRHPHQAHEREGRGSVDFPPPDSYYGPSGSGGPPIPNSPSEEDKALMVEFAPPTPKMARTLMTESPPAGGYYQHGQYEDLTPKSGHRSSRSGDTGTADAPTAAVAGLPSEERWGSPVEMK